MPTWLVRLTCLCASLLVANCSDDESDRQKPADQPSAAASTSSDKRWMHVDNKLTPAQWLVSQGLDQPKPVNDPDVRNAAATLQEANRLYRESERMIANRAVQLEHMLREIGVQENATSILTDLTRVAGEVGQTEGFGALSQQYFNIRASRIEREPALAELRARYGRRQ